MLVIHPFSVRWIRLLHHCLTAYKEVEESVASAAAQIPNLMNTCSALLVSPISSVYVPNIEEVLLKLGLHSVDMGLALVDNILRCPSNRANSGWKHYFHISQNWILCCYYMYLWLRNRC